MSLAIAYFSFRRGMPPLISSCFYPLIGEKIYGILGYGIDVLAVFATVFGIVTSLGLGAMQITTGLGEVFRFAPTLLTFLWFSVFGGAAFYLELQEGAEIATAVSEGPSVGLFRLYAHYPLSGLLTMITVLLLGVFFVTSADSATFVLSMMTSRGNLYPSAAKKITWGILVSSTAVILLYSGGLEALQKMAIAAALPFTVIMLFLCRSLIKGLRYEFKFNPAVTLNQGKQET